jgi:phage terminase large subunit GpA-like protein
MGYRLTIVTVILGAVVLAGCQTTTGRTAGAVVDDSSTTAAVKSKLVADRPANLTAVGVDTVNGVVYLTGVVDTPEQRIRAEQLAWQSAGARQVVNNIQVQRPPVAVAPSASAATTPGVTPRRSVVVGRVSSVDASRSQVTVATGTEQLLLQLPPGLVRDLRPGDQITLDVQPAR